jgi:hypothetical protein
MVRVSVVYYFVGALMMIIGILLIQELFFEMYTELTVPFTKWYPVIALTLVVLGVGIIYRGLIQSEK